MRTFLPIVLLLILSSICLPLSAQHNYAEVLQKSLFFYEAQQAGPLSPNNRVSWRGDAAMTDGDDVGVDLRGGWFDAGDHVKFNLPMSYSVTTLCWGYLENKEAYTQAGQAAIFLENIKHVTDYLMRCHTGPNELYAQVGDGVEDHKYWASAEVVEIRSKRPSFKVDAANPGSDVAGETAAALAAASICFQDSDPSYSALLLQHAKEIYTFADTYRGKYSDVIPVGSFYNSWSGYNDELCWGAIWLFKATDDQSYLDRATDAYDYLGTIERGTDKDYSWTLAWDNKQYGCYVLMAALTGESKYNVDAERHLDEWFTNKSGKPGPTCTPAGFPILDEWGSNRYAANSAFLLLEQSDNMLAGQKKEAYKARAKEIIDYCLGDNPQNMSYVIGYGENYPQYPHHRSAHGSWCRSETIPAETRHILYGALVGGHKKTDDFDWVDDRHDYVWNEVATDYNSLFQGAIARLYADFGGSIDPTFPMKEVPSNEFAVEAKLNSSGSTHSEFAVWVYNKTSWPARIPSTFAFRLYFNLSEGIDAGYSVSDYIVSSNGNSVTCSKLLEADAANGIYYVEVTFNSDEIIYPGGQGESKREAQVRVRLPYDANASAWDPTNDWSMTGLTGGLKEVSNIPLYADGELVYGNLPVEPVIVPVEGVTLSSSTEEIEVGRQVQLSATILPFNASDKVVTWSSSNSSIVSVSSAGKVTAISEGNAEIICKSNDGNISATCAVTVIPEVVIPVTGVELSSTSLDIDTGERITLSASVLPTNASDTELTWASDNNAVATVSQQGVIVGVAEGVATVSVTSVDGGFTSSCVVTVSKVVLPEYTITTQVVGNGTISVDPVQDSYTQGTDVTILATPDSGYQFVSWSGDSSSSDASIVVVLNSNLDLTANFVEKSSEVATPISLPFQNNGVGEFSWSTTDDISFINSWNLKYLTINGVDFTNTWSNSLPAKQDGKYIIRYKSDVAWGHFEANAPENKDMSPEVPSVTGITVSNSVLDLNTEESRTLSADVLPNNASNKEVTWSSDNNAVVTVSQQGVVVGVATGSATISATTVDGKFVASCSVTVHDVTLPDPTNTTAISIPFKQDGSGVYTWSTTDEIYFINSWSLDYLIINGVDFTNVWSNSMPAKQDGKYYIEYKATATWAHFEASGIKSLSIDGNNASSTQGKLSVFPNPASDFIRVNLPSEASQLEIYNVVGTKVLQQTVINETQLSIGISHLPSGVYIVKVIASSGQAENKRILIK